MNAVVLAIVIVGAVVVLAVLIGAVTVKRGYDHMSEALVRLTAEVAETRSVNASLRAAFTGLATQIRENAEDPAALNALADALDADQAETVAAITANTPAAPVADDDEPLPEQEEQAQE
jgi:hypothetical protein